MFFFSFFFLFFFLLFFLNHIFSIFPIVKMNANYAEICKVGNLEANLQQVPLVQFFLNENFTILLGNIKNSNSA